MNDLQFNLLRPIEHRDRILELLAQLNPKLDPHLIASRFDLMIQEPNYVCFGLFKKDQLIGLSSGWTTFRIYCGQQLELDNVIIDSNIQSRGYGKYFIEAIMQWSQKNKYECLGLNTYVQNHRSHKFYYNQNFKVVGFHFLRTI